MHETVWLTTSEEPLLNNSRIRIYALTDANTLQNLANEENWDLVKTREAFYSGDHFYGKAMGEIVKTNAETYNVLFLPDKNNQLVAIILFHRDSEIQEKYGFYIITKDSVDVKSINSLAYEIKSLSSNSVEGDQLEKEKADSVNVAFDSPPESIRMVTPNYPKSARELGLEGKVMLEVIIEKDGTVSNARVIKSLQPGPGRCDEEAIKAALQSQFTPAKQKGKPVSVRIMLPYRFTLTD